MISVSFLETINAENKRVERTAVALIRIMSGDEVKSSATATVDRENVRITPRIVSVLLVIFLSFEAYLSKAANGRVRYVTPTSEPTRSPEMMAASS